MCTDATSPRLATWTHRGTGPALFRLPEVMGQMMRIFEASEEEIEEVVAELRERPPGLSDIGQQVEMWACRGGVTVIRETDWDWHDLRAIYCQDWRYRLEVPSHQHGEHFRFQIIYGEVRVDLSLPEPLVEQIRAVLSAA